MNKFNKYTSFCVASKSTIILQMDKIMKNRWGCCLSAEISSNYDYSL